MNIPTKETIVSACVQLLHDRIRHAQKAMNAAQEASNSEDKSSAGDKYETSRAMGQLDRDMNARQLVQAQNDLKTLLMTDIQPTSFVRTGSIVRCDTDMYFIAFGMGPVLIDGVKVIVISPKSPLGLAMNGKRIKESFVFNNKEVSITEVL
jgi:transcription elongation GreA/GreB family factor